MNCQGHRLNLTGEVSKIITNDLRNYFSLKLNVAKWLVGIYNVKIRANLGKNQFGTKRSYSKPVSDD